MWNGKKPSIEEMFYLFTQIFIFFCEILFGNCVADIKIWSISRSIERERGGGAGLICKNRTWIINDVLIQYSDWKIVKKAKRLFRHHLQSSPSVWPKGWGSEAFHCWGACRKCWAFGDYLMARIFPKACSWYRLLTGHGAPSGSGTPVAHPINSVECFRWCWASEVLANDTCNLAPEQRAYCTKCRDKLSWTNW